MRALWEHLGAGGSGPILVDPQEQDNGVITRLFDCPPRERLRRTFILFVAAGVIYVPAAVTFAMLVTGNA